MSDYQYWENALAGKFEAVHGNDPQCGFYETQNKKSGTRDACAIWRGMDGKLIASKGGKNIEPDELWSWVCRNPISEELFRRVERGEGWPDAIEELIGHNNPPTDEIEKDEIQSAIDAALLQLKSPVVSQVDADRLGNHRDRLSKLWTAQEKQRKDEKQPHLAAGEAVDDKFKPILAGIKDAGEKLKAALTKWMVAEKQKADALALEQARKDDEARRVAIAQNEPVPEPVAAPEPFKPKAGTVGRTIALRTFKSAVITDYAKALAAVAENSEIKELVQTLADRAARADIALAGCEIKLEQRAA